MVMEAVIDVRTDTLLEVRNLNVDYFASNGTVNAVTDVSFTLRHGEILGLAGESGSGKSTLVYAITRLLRPPATVTGVRSCILIIISPQTSWACPRVNYGRCAGMTWRLSFRVL